jgi:hypothetical protein
LRNGEQERVEEVVDLGAVGVALGEVDDQGRDDGGRERQPDDRQETAAEISMGVGLAADDRDQLATGVLDVPMR